MRNIILVIFFALATALNAQTSKFNDLFNQLQNTKGVTTVSINKGMFNMIKNIDLGEEVNDLEDIIKNVNAVKMIVFDSNLDNVIQNKFDQIIKDTKYEELMSINSEDSNIKFFTEDSSAKSFRNLVLDISSDKERMFLLLDGEIKASDIQKQIKIASK